MSVDAEHTRNVFVGRGSPYCKSPFTEPEKDEYRGDDDNAYRHTQECVFRYGYYLTRHLKAYVALDELGYGRVGDLENERDSTDYDRNKTHRDDLLSERVYVSSASEDSNVHEYRDRRRDHNSDRQSKPYGHSLGYHEARHGICTEGGDYALCEIGRERGLEYHSDSKSN